MKVKTAPIPFTKEGYEKIKKEYEEVLESRKGAVETLRQARELGDLSENGLYKAARARLSSIDNRLNRLSVILKLATIIENKNKDTIAIGSKVELHDEKGGRRGLTLVGPYESDPLSNKISINSPLGLSLIGKKKGERIIINAPKGKITYAILKIMK